MELYRFASVDIGSNAVRLFFALVVSSNNKVVKIKKLSFLRVPIRLGEDTFLRKQISKKNANALVKTMRAFKDLCPEYGVQAYEACATSAIRDAVNGQEIIKRIKKEVGIKINIIDGQVEAKLIFNSSKDKKFSKYNTCLYIDVGGGSTELTLLSGKKIIASRSFNIGTIRLLQNKVLPTEWSALKEWIKKHCTPFKSVVAIGTGGNINTLFKLSEKNADEPITLSTLKKLSSKINSMSYHERIVKLDMAPDRADVIVPAEKIFLSIMKWANIKEI
ncbi:MAG: hypothetical protein A3K10_10335, partial [Bacteroidetes bacterium RIFCSPLOWO2_12_FULL_31_6]